VTGEWYIPGHKAIGFRSPEVLAGRGFSKGVVDVAAKVDETGIVPLTGIVLLLLLLEGVEFKSIEIFASFLK
jgi:hypothetical protein